MGSRTIGHQIDEQAAPPRGRLVDRTRSRAEACRRAAANAKRGASPTKLSDARTSRATAPRGRAPRRPSRRRPRAPRRPPARRPGPTRRRDRPGLLAHPRPPRRCAISASRRRSVPRCVPPRAPGVRGRARDEPRPAATTRRTRRSPRVWVSGWSRARARARACCAPARPPRRPSRRPAPRRGLRASAHIGARAAAKTFSRAETARRLGGARRETAPHVEVAPGSRTARLLSGRLPPRRRGFGARPADGARAIAQSRGRAGRRRRARARAPRSAVDQLLRG